MAMCRWVSKVGRSSSHALGAHGQSPRLPLGLCWECCESASLEESISAEVLLAWKPTLSKNKLAFIFFLILAQHSAFVSWQRCWGFPEP